MSQHETCTQAFRLFFFGAVLVQAVALGVAGTGLDRLYKDCDGLKRCHNELIPSWWSLSFQLFVLVALLLVGLADLVLAALDRFRIPLVALLATSTVTTMLEAQRGLATINAEDTSDVEKSASKLVVGGVITMSIMNILLMGVVGYTAPQVNQALYRRLFPLAV